MQKPLTLASINSKVESPKTVYSIPQRLAMQLGFMTIPTSENEEPKITSALYITVIALITVVALAYFLGKSSGRQEADIDHLQIQVQQIEKDKEEKRRIENNFKLAEELSAKQKQAESNSNKGN